MRLAALQSLICIEAAELSGYSAPAVVSLFPADLRGMSPRCRPPFPCESGFILSCALPPLQSTDRFSPARTPLRASSTFLGVLFPIAAPTSRVHFPVSFPRSPMFRPQRFSRSRRLAPLGALRACFIPLPRPGFTLQGLPPQPSHRDSSPRRPLLSLTTLTSSRVAPTVQLLPSRLQGFDPGCDPLRRTECLDLSTPDPLLSFHSLGLFSGHLGDGFTSPPLVALAAASCV
jgi:hypothetical protein